MSASTLWAHPSGALYIPERETALIADLHLGYAWAQRRRGELGPLDDGGLLNKLRETLESLRPECVVLLGDIYHAPSPSSAERSLVEQALALITGQLIVVRGNHDRAIARDFGLSALPAWEAPGLLAVHGDQLPQTDRFLIMGHLHPVVNIRDAAGASRRVPVFQVKKTVCCLPAFSPFAAGVAVRGGQLYAATGKRVVPLSGAKSAQAPVYPDHLPGHPTLLRIK
ncbi:MAG: metallophosphoesterase [Acidobacteria bacterium]|nr:metallophosphoesterase [Acidobacteriota bacterium]